MRKIIVDFDESMNQIRLEDGSMFVVNSAVTLIDAPKNDVLSLVKAGLSADDLINLKKADLL